MSQTLASSSPRPLCMPSVTIARRSQLRKAKWRPSADLRARIQADPPFAMQWLEPV